MKVRSHETSGRLQLCSFSAAVIFLLGFSAFEVCAQELPQTIRGYKVHKQRPAAPTNPGESSRSEFELGKLKVVDVSLSGLTLDLRAAVGPAPTAGRIDFITFHDFQVNGIPVEVEEFRHSFALRRTEPTELPAPIRIFVPAQRVLHAAWKEFTTRAAEWKVTGRVFFFGRFRKFGMTFRRVVPVDVDLAIKNPLSAP